MLNVQLTSYPMYLGGFPHLVGILDEVHNTILEASLLTTLTYTMAVDFFIIGSVELLNMA